MNVREVSKILKPGNIIAIFDKNNAASSFSGSKIIVKNILSVSDTYLAIIVDVLSGPDSGRKDEQWGIGNTWDIHFVSEDWDE